MREYKENNLDNQSRKREVIKIYNNILQQFCKNIVCGHIIKLERGIITTDGEEYYKDYFETTHTEMKEELRKNNPENDHKALLMVNKAITKDKEIIFSQDTKTEIPGKEILFLDNIFYNTPKNMLHLFEETLIKLRVEEKLYRDRKNLENIQTTTQDNIAKDIEKS